MEEIKNKAEKLERSEEEKVSGGYVIQRSKLYLLVSDIGGWVLGEYKSIDEAQDAAKAQGISAKIITFDEYNNLKNSDTLNYDHLGKI